MTYDTWSGKTWGVPEPAYPATSGNLHVKYVNNPMSPNLLQRHFEVDPYGTDVNGVINPASLRVEPNMGQNVILTSGNNLAANSPGQFFDQNSQRSFVSPRVVPEFTLATAGSGLPGLLGDAYPTQLQNNGLSPNGVYPLNNSF